jgi:predicted TIM-barrel fold metal-dependent hydrolase
MAETAPNELAGLSLLPSEYFRRQFFGCFWFERSTIKPTVDFLGSHCLLFETDFPHPTCLYPRDDVQLLEAFEGLEDADIRAMLQDNAAALYRIDIS